MVVVAVVVVAVVVVAAAVVVVQKECFFVFCPSPELLSSLFGPLLGAEKAFSAKRAYLSQIGCFFGAKGAKLGAQVKNEPIWAR